MTTATERPLDGRWDTCACAGSAAPAAAGTGSDMLCLLNRPPPHGVTPRLAYPVNRLCAGRPESSPEEDDPAAYARRASRLARTDLCRSLRCCLFRCVGGGG